MLIIKISYYWFNRKELLEKAEDRYHNHDNKKEAAEYYKNREVLDKDAKTGIKAKREY